MAVKLQKSLKKNSHKAFTLLELSVVLIIVGILATTIIIGGDGLIRSARISNARSATADSQISATEGLIAWYESSMPDSFNISEATVDNSQLSNWYDRNPSSLPLKKNALNATPSANVIYNFDAINKAQSVAFNGSGKLSISSFYQGSFAQATIFVVFRPSTISSMTLIDSGASKATSSISISATNITLNAGNAVSTAISGNRANFSAGTNYIIAAYFNGANSKVYLNDTATQAGNGSAMNIGSNMLDGITIGSNNAGSSGFNGKISEVIIFNRLLNAQERKDAMKYLAKKYKIVVAGF